MRDPQPVWSKRQAQPLGSWDDMCAFNVLRTVDARNALALPQSRFLTKPAAKSCCGCRASRWPILLAIIPRRLLEAFPTYPCVLRGTQSPAVCTMSGCGYGYGYAAEKSSPPSTRRLALTGVTRRPPFLLGITSSEGALLLR
jgi:hypothetical protein